MNRNRYLLAMFAAVVSLAISDVSFSSPLITIAPDKPVCSPGDSITVQINVDMGGGSDLLGEYSIEITWNPAIISFGRAAGGTSDGFKEILSNDTKAGTGSLVLSYVNTSGSARLVNISRIIFVARGGYGSKTQLSLVVKSLSTAVTFNDLSKSATIQPASISINSPPVISTTSLPDATQGTPYSATIAATDPDTGDYCAFDLLSAPAWMTIDEKSGVLSGTPQQGDEGAELAVWVRTRDSFGLADTLRTTIDVTASATKNYLAILEPKAGASWSIGIENRIQWTFRGVSEVKIELSTNNGTSWETIAEHVLASNGSFTWKVPDRKSNTCMIRLSDNGNATLTDVSEIFAIIQPTIQIELVNQVNQAVQNASITFSARIICDAGLDMAKLYWDTTGSRVFDHPLLMKSTDGLNYSALLSEGLFTANGIEYYIEAIDKTGSSVRIPSGGDLYSVSAAVTDVVSQAPVTAGTEQTAFRMISVPLILTATVITEQLSGRLPQGEMGADWRLFRFPPGADQPEEYPNIEGFSPGKAFWMIARNDFTLKAPPGTTVSTADRFKLELKPGWNDIANPWTFPISWGDIDNPSNAVLDGLYSYENQWSLPDSRQTMIPWKGYSVRNMMNGPIIVFLNPKPATTAEKAISDFPRLDWKINVAAQAGKARDTENVIGVGKYAKNSWDIYDHAEPPPIGEYVSLTFPHRDWNEFPYDYTTDIRLPDEEIIWDFVVRTNIKRETVRIAVDGLNNVPDGYYFSIIDTDNNYKLIKNPDDFYFTSGDSYSERHYRIIANKNKESSRNHEYPSRSVTARWYPNPFNMSTTVKYELSLPGKVFIRLYNILGQNIITHDLGYQIQGYHSFVISGVSLPSGLYFYRIEAPYASAVGKILCIK